MDYLNEIARLLSRTVTAMRSVGTLVITYVGMRVTQSIDRSSVSRGQELLRVFKKRFKPTGREKRPARRKKEPTGRKKEPTGRKKRTCRKKSLDNLETSKLF